MGLAFRAMGAGLRTYFGQFMKGQKYSELEAVKMAAPYITIEQYGEPGFIHIHGASEKDVQKARQAMFSGKYNIIVFDEICTAHHFGLISAEEMLDIIKEKPDGVEVIFTGRYAPSEVIEAADLVTEMADTKHYFQKGVKARIGIER